MSSSTTKWGPQVRGHLEFSQHNVSYFGQWAKWPIAEELNIWDTAGARIIERSQEYKSTVKYRTFVLLRVPIPRGVGKFNYRTGPGKH